VFFSGKLAKPVEGLPKPAGSENSCIEMQVRVSVLRI
jgi:hypothetical protein